MYNIFCFRTVVKSSLLDKETVLNLHPMHEFPVSTACSCLRSQASHLGATARPKSSSPSSRLADRFMQSASIISRALEKDQNDGDDDEDNDDDDESQNLASLLATLERFSSRVLNPLQAKSITRLAHGFVVRENLNWKLAQQVIEFLESDSPPIQDAILIVLAKLVAAIREESPEDVLEVTYHNARTFLQLLLR